MSRPKKKKKRDDREKIGMKGIAKNEMAVVEVVEDEDEESDGEELSRLLGEDVRRPPKWRGSTRLLLLDEQLANKSIEELPEAIKVVFQENDGQCMELVKCKLTLFYDYWELHEVVLDKNRPKIQTVVNKVEAIHNEYRTMQLEILAGNKSLVTTLVENGLRFHVDLAAVYWNSRLATERQRLLSCFTRSDVVCDVFAGVGPIAISAAKEVKHVYANDLNPCAVEYLERNCVLNKLERKIEVFNMDGRRFIETVFASERTQCITQVVMHLPKDAAEFLGKEYVLPRIHVYGFSKAQDPEFDFDERIRIALSEAALDVEMHRVRAVAPGKWMLCASFILPESVAYSKTGSNL
ncbi:UNVERIFIED_CONTAM: tRNA (guanine(37)-N1)-methyltransferase 1 [Sesamum latifolium]|uniref:tRNA (guanine(37)-N1)-methyltransferase n=1 Tax=Sesamum latifolium TaxID=2727402 RepID=A0AAW2WNS6_9LAMI